MVEIPKAKIELRDDRTKVRWTDGSVHQEKIPDTRLRIPLGIRASYLLGDNVIIRAYYRYYTVKGTYR